jgi:hypothetical protein
MAYFNTVDYVTIASTGNATDFGDLTAAKTGVGSCASPTRALERSKTFKQVALAMSKQWGSL